MPQQTRPGAVTTDDAVLATQTFGSRLLGDLLGRPVARHPDAGLAVPSALHEDVKAFDMTGAGGHVMFLDRPAAVCPKCGGYHDRLYDPRADMSTSELFAWLEEFDL